MNALGWLLLWSAVPITLLAAVGLVLERLAARRGPVAGSWVSAASLLFIVVLTPLAVCGLPAGWSWQLPSFTNRADLAPGAVAWQAGTDSSVTAPARAPTVGDFAGEGRGMIWSAAWWHRLRDGAAREMRTVRQRTRLLHAAWGAFVLSGAVWCLARLLLGLRGVSDCRRQSSSIGDPGVLAEVESFRFALSIPRQVEVRELSSLIGSTAAAAGWLRPFVLLPRDWRSWSHLERRAVLAHEMAHIGRADYVSGIIAQLGLVLHFYHPMVHWLVARLQLQQELAADALGAPLAGGRRDYLLALSRLALRPDENLLAWPARTFLRSGGHLIRRIQMLKVNAQGEDRSFSTVAKVITMTLLAAVGATAVAFRGLAPARAAETPPAAAVKSESNGQRFDLSYLSPDAKGVYAVRPAAIFRLPGLKQQFEKIDAAITNELWIGLPKLELIEQATVEFKLLPRDPDKKLPGRLMTGDWTVRTVNDFDWKPPIKKLVKVGKTPGRLVEVPYEHRVYYKAVGSGIFGPDACFYFPDTRTAVCSFHEEHLRRRIQQGSSQGPEFLRGDDWQRIDCGLMATAIDNRDGRLKLDLASDDPMDLPIAPLLQQASRWVVGLDAAELLKFRAIATCADPKQGEALERLVHERMVKAASALDGVIQGSLAEKDPEAVALYRTAKLFLPACRLHRDGSVIDLSTEGKVEPDALAELFSILTPF